MQHTSTKVVLIFYVLVSTIALAVAFGNFLSHWDNREQHLLKKEIILNNVDFEEIIVNCCYDGAAEWPDGIDTIFLSDYMYYTINTYVHTRTGRNESSEESKSNILIAPLVRPAKQPPPCQVRLVPRT